MASVKLGFVAPYKEDLTRMLVFESDSATGAFTQIDAVDDIGDFPNYIDSYTTDQASTATDWFAIQWIDSKGAKSDLSVPIKGGTDTLVGLVVDRVMQRDPALSRAVVSQEAEAAIERYFAENPYLVDPTEVSYRILNGLAYLAMARTLTVNQSQGAADRVTIGLTTVANSSGATISQKAIDELLDLARAELGIDQSIILQMAEPRRRHETRMILEL